MSVFELDNQNKTQKNPFEDAGFESLVRTQLQKQVSAVEQKNPFEDAGFEELVFNTNRNAFNTQSVANTLAADESGGDLATMYEKVGNEPSRHIEAGLRSAYRTLPDLGGKVAKFLGDSANATDSPTIKAAGNVLNSLGDAAYFIRDIVDPIKPAKDYDKEYGVFGKFASADYWKDPGAFASDLGDLAATWYVGGKATGAIKGFATGSGLITGKYVGDAITNMANKGLRKMVDKAVTGGAKGGLAAEGTKITFTNPVANKVVDAVKWLNTPARVTNGVVVNNLGNILASGTAGAMLSVPWAMAIAEGEKETALTEGASPEQAEIIRTNSFDNTLRVAGIAGVVGGRIFTDKGTPLLMDVSLPAITMATQNVVNQTDYDKTMGKEVGEVTEPWTWTDSQWNAAKKGLVSGGAFGVVGRIAKGYKFTDKETPKTEIKTETQRREEPPDIADASWKPTDKPTGGPDGGALPQIKDNTKGNNGQTSQTEIIKNVLANAPANKVKYEAIDEDGNASLLDVTKSEVKSFVDAQITGTKDIKAVENPPEGKVVYEFTNRSNKYRATIDTQATTQAPEQQTEQPNVEVVTEQPKEPALAAAPTEDNNVLWGNDMDSRNLSTEDYFSSAHADPSSNAPWARMTTETGRTVPVRYGFTDPQSISVSNDPLTFEPNPNYDQRYQQRNRQGIQMKQQVENNAANLNPALLGYSDGVNMGAPVVITDSHNVDTVINGNGRAMAILRAMQTNPDAIKAYHNYLIKHAWEYGMDSEGLTQFFEEHPNAILIRQIQEDDDIVQEIAGATGGGMTLSAAEQAVRDASKVPEHVWDRFVPNEQGQVDNTTNHDFVAGVLGNICSKNELNEFMPDANGELSLPGEIRIRNALFAYAYGDKRLVSDVANFAGGDNLTGQTVNGLTRAAGAVAKARASMVKTNHEELNFIPKLVEAARAVKQFGNNSAALESAIGSKSLFEEEDAGSNTMALDNETKRILAILYANKGSGAAIGKFIKGMATAVIDATEAENNLLGMENETLATSIMDVIEQGAKVAGVKPTELGKIQKEDENDVRNARLEREGDGREEEKSGSGKTQEGNGAGAEGIGASGAQNSSAIDRGSGEGIGEVATNHQELAEQIEKAGDVEEVKSWGNSAADYLLKKATERGETLNPAETSDEGPYFISAADAHNLVFENPTLEGKAGVNFDGDFITLDNADTAGMALQALFDVDDKFAQAAIDEAEHIVYNKGEVYVYFKRSNKPFLVYGYVKAKGKMLPAKENKGPKTLVERILQKYGLSNNNADNTNQVEVDLSPKQVYSILNQQPDSNITEAIVFRAEATDAVDAKIGDLKKAAYHFAQRDVLDESDKPFMKIEKDGTCSIGFVDEAGNRWDCEFEDDGVVPDNAAGNVEELDAVLNGGSTHQETTSALVASLQHIKPTRQETSTKVSAADFAKKAKELAENVNSPDSISQVDDFINNLNNLTLHEDGAVYGQPLRTINDLDPEERKNYQLVSIDIKKTMNKVAKLLERGDIAGAKNKAESLRDLNAKRKAILEGGEGDDLHSTGTGIEENSGGGDASNTLGAAADGQGPAGRNGQNLGGSEKAGQGSNDTSRIPGNSTASGGAEIVLQSTATESGVGTTDSGGTRLSGLSGSLVERDSELQQGNTRGILESAQNRENNAAVVRSDLEGKWNKEISEKIPFLLPDQVGDVAFGLRRLLDEGHAGVMFADGTGTGKTFIGLGMVQQMVWNGKSNILIIAPSQSVIDDWVRTAHNYFKAADGSPLKITVLGDTKTNGKGVTITTYANFYQNDSLVKRDWDMVVADEAHKLMSSEKAAITSSVQMFRAVTRNPLSDGLYKRAEILYQPTAQEAVDMANWNAEIEKLMGKIAALNADHDLEEIQTLQAEITGYRNKIEPIERRVSEERSDAMKEWSKIAESDRPKVVMLTATPFAYVENIDYANGYLFDYGEDEDPGGSGPSARDKFFMEHFGYRYRYHKLTKPSADVNSDVMEVQFHEWLRKTGALTGHTAHIDADFSRKFIVVDNAIGKKISDAFEFMREHLKEYVILLKVLDKTFTNDAQRKLLESIKAAESVSIAKEYLKLGKKVIIFHDTNKARKVANPFLMDTIVKSVREMKDGPTRQELLLDIDSVFFREEYAKFRSLPQFQELFGNSMNLKSPLEIFEKEFGNEAMYFNGNVPLQKRRANIAAFQNDDSGKNLIIVQKDAGETGLNLHDTTGKHPRVAIFVATPSRPTAATQLEGRARRYGSVSNTIFRYLTTGTSFETGIFARTIAARASTVENLAMGTKARALRDAFVDAYMETTTDDWQNYLPGKPNDDIGGVEIDKATENEISEYERAKAFYYGNAQKTSRTKSAEGNDYYATPEPIGFKMVEWANLGKGEDALEPSAGHGAISRFFSATTHNVVIEPSQKLSALAAMYSDGADVKTMRFEDYSTVNKFDAVVMNPPFGTAGKLAMEHVAKAFKHLRHNGRLIALIPRGKMDERFDKWYESEEAANAVLVATINLPSVTFKRAGTGVNTRIVILDKKETTLPYQPTDVAHTYDFSDIDNIGELFDALEDLRIPEREMTDYNNAEKVDITYPGFVYSMTHNMLEQHDVKYRNAFLKSQAESAASRYHGQVIGGSAYFYTQNDADKFSHLINSQDFWAKAVGDETQIPNGLQLHENTVDYGGLTKPVKDIDRASPEFHKQFNEAMQGALTKAEIKSVLDYFDQHRGSSQETAEYLAAVDGYRFWRQQRESHQGAIFGKLWQKVYDYAKNNGNSLEAEAEKLYNMAVKESVPIATDKKKLKTSIQLTLNFEADKDNVQTAPGGYFANDDAVRGDRDSVLHGIKVKGFGFTRELVEEKSIDLTGRVVHSAKELATIAQVLRHPGYEKLHRIYVDKNGRILEHQTISCGLPDCCKSLTEEEEKRGRVNIPAGAAKIYLIHNHPSGNPTPSSRDREFAKICKKVFKGLDVKHIVLDTDRYALIHGNGNYVFGSIPANAQIKYDVPSVQHRALMEQVSADSAAGLVKYVEGGKDTVFFLDANNKIRSIIELPDNAFMNGEEYLSDEQITNYLRDVAKAYYGNKAIVATKNILTFFALGRVMEAQGGIVDVIYATDNKGGNLAGAFGQSNSKKWFGQDKGEPAYKVLETNAPYNDKDSALSSVVSSPVSSGLSGAYQKGGVMGAITYLKDDFYTKWVDKYYPFEKFDDATKARGAERIINKVHMLTANIEGNTNALLLGGTKDIEFLQKKLNIKLHDVSLKDVLSVLNTKELDKKYPDYLASHSVTGKTWVDMFNNYLVWRRLLEMAQHHDQAYMQALTEWKKKVEAEKYWADNDGAEATRPEKAGPAPKYEPYILPKKLQEANITEEDLQRAIEQAPEEFERAANLFYLWNDNILSVLEQGGIIDGKLHNLLNTKYKNYCSLMRDFSDENSIEDFVSGLTNGGKGIGNVKQMIKRISLEGSERAVLSPLEVAVKSCSIAVNRAERNKVAQFAVKKLEDNGHGIIEVVEGQTHPDPLKGIFTVMEHGKTIAYKCHSPELYQAISMWDSSAAMALTDLMGKFARMLRWGATTDPSFIIRNGVKDTVAAFVSSDSDNFFGFIPFFDTIFGIYKMHTDPEFKAKIDGSGIAMFNQFSRSSAVKGLIRRMTSGDGITLRSLLDTTFGLEKLSMEVEKGTRAGIYYRAIRNGKNDEEAQLGAMRGTLNFSRSGSLGQKKNSSTAFFNAQVQGIDQVLRILGGGIKATANLATGGGKLPPPPPPGASQREFDDYNERKEVRHENFVKMLKLARMLSLAIPAVLLYVYLDSGDDKDWYDELDPRIKYTSWVFPGKYMLPMPHEMGMFAGLAIASLDYYKHNHKQAYSHWLAAVRDSFAVNLLPTGLVPIIEGVSNYSFFTGRPLENMNMIRNMKAWERYRGATSEFSKYVSKSLYDTTNGHIAISPIKIDNTIRGYFGKMGTFVIKDIFDTAAELTGAAATKPAKALSEKTFIRDFVVTDYKLGRYTNEFMKIAEEVQQNKKGYSSSLRGNINDLMNEINELYRLNREVDFGEKYPMHSPEWKRKFKERNNEKIRALSKRGVERFGDKVKH